MIGQKTLKQTFSRYIENNAFPKFTLLIGEQGSGKKEFVRWLSEKTGYELAVFEPTVDSVRELISLCYQQTKPIIYLVPDGNNLSATAENALLKICEEPPKNSYIVLTTNNDLILPTIKSRAFTAIMEPYSEQGLTVFARKLTNKDNLQEKIELSTTPGDLLMLDVCDSGRLFQLCDNIVNNITKANIGSVLKISKNIQVKREENNSLFDMQLFLKVLLYKYLINSRKKGMLLESKRCYEIVFSAKRQLQYNYNKQYILDDMLLRLRDKNAGI